MVVPKSQLAAFVADCATAIAAGCASAIADLVQVTPDTVSITVQVIDDTKPGIVMGETRQEAPESVQTTVKGAATDTQTTVKAPSSSSESQSTAPTEETQTTAFGRGSVTETSFTS